MTTRHAARRIRVLLLSRYGRLGSSSRLRSLQYLPYLEAHGFEIEVHSLLDDQYVRRLNSGNRQSAGRIASAYIARASRIVLRRRWDLVWIEREAFPWVPASLELAWLRQCEVPYVLEMDDAVYLRYSDHSSRLVRAALDAKIDRLMRDAELVIGGSECIAERAIGAGARWVERLPTVVDLARYSSQLGAPRPGLTIGWIGSPTTAPFLNLVAEPLRRLCDRYNDIRLVVVGANAPPMHGVLVACKEWSEHTEADDVGEFDVGIMPLPDSPFARGKCGHKLIQYMACGKPVVASPVGENNVIVTAGVNGLLAGSCKEWVDQIDLLYRDPALRFRLGAAGRKMVEEHFSLQVTAPRLAEMLGRAAAGAGSRHRKP